MTRRGCRCGISRSCTHRRKGQRLLISSIGEEPIFFANFFSLSKGSLTPPVANHAEGPSPCSACFSLQRNRKNSPKNGFIPSRAIYEGPSTPKDAGWPLRTCSPCHSASVRAGRGSPTHPAGNGSAEGSRAGRDAGILIAHTCRSAASPACRCRRDGQRPDRSAVSLCPARWVARQVIGRCRYEELWAAAACRTPRVSALAYGQAIPNASLETASRSASCGHAAGGASARQLPVPGTARLVSDPRTEQGTGAVTTLEE